MAYCKYCLSRCSLVPDDGVYACSNCGAGLAPTDSVELHGSFRRFEECIAASYAVSLEASQLGLIQDGCGRIPECPHLRPQNSRITGRTLIQEMRRSVGVLAAEREKGQHKSGAALN